MTKTNLKVIEEVIFNVGDKVQHLCGGPIMIVEDAVGLESQAALSRAGLINPNEDKYKQVACVYFDKNDVFHKMLFHTDFLQKV